MLRKVDDWKVLLAESVVIAHQKLSQYYSKADRARGQIYNWATVLDLTQRLAVYKSPQFDPKLHQQYDQDIRQTYDKKYANLDAYTEPALAPVPSAARLSFTALAASKIRQRSAVSR